MHLPNLVFDQKSVNPSPRYRQFSAQAPAKKKTHFTPQKNLIQFSIMTLLILIQKYQNPPDYHKFKTAH
jgi:hypothetical protein